MKENILLNATYSKSQEIKNDKTQILSIDSEEAEIKKEEEKLKQLNRENKKKKLDFYNNLILIFCMIFFSTIIFMQFEIENRYKVKKTLKTHFGFNDLKNEYFLTILNISNFLTELKQNITKIYLNNNYWLLDNKYQLISNFRSTLRKIKKTSKNPIQPLINMKLQKLKWITNTINPNKKYNKKIEDKEDYLIFKYDKENSYLNLGGFVLLFEKEDSLDYEDNLFLFLNKDAASIITDFTIYNFERRYFCSIVFTNQIYDFGISTIHLNIYINDRDLYESKLSIFRLVFECLFLISFIFSNIFFFIKINFHVNCEIEEFKEIKGRKYDIIIEDEKKKVSVKENKNVNILDKSSEFEFKVKDLNFKNKKKKKKKKRKMSLKLPKKLTFFIKYFFTDFFLIIQLLTLILEFLSIIFWIMYIIKMKKLYKNLDESEKNDIIISIKTQNKLIEAGKILIIYKRIVILSLFFLFLKLVEIFSLLSKRANTFINTIKYSFGDLFSFFIFLMVILLGFSTFSWLFYGRQFEEFYTLNFSFQQNFSFFLGIIDSDIFIRMYDSHGAMTICYFIIIIVIVRFIILKIILAILLRSFGLAYNEYLKIISFKDLEKSNFKEIVPRPISRFIYWYSLSVNKIINFITCKSNIKSKNNENNEFEFSCRFTEENIVKLYCPEMISFRKRKNKKHHSISSNLNVNLNKIEKINYLTKVTQLKNFDKYDIEYHEDFEFLNRNVYFDSERDKIKLKVYYENKYRRYFYKALFYLCFIIVFIIIFLLNNLSPWNFKILHSFGTAFNQTEKTLNSKYNILNENENFLPWKINNPINEINSLPKIRKFLFTDIKSLFKLNYTPDNNERYAFLNYNYLIGNKILVTLKREKKSKREKNINKNVSIREEENLNIMKLNYEDKKYFIVDNNNENNYFQWEQYKSYKKYGGYYFEFDLNKNYSETFQKELINEYTNFIIIEFLLQNYEYQIVQHVTIKFILDYGSYFKSNFNVQLLKYKIIQKPIDEIKIFFEIIYIFLFIGVIIFFIKALKEDYLSYNKWYRDMIVPLNIKIRDIRNRIEPEFIREFIQIFGLNQFFEVIIIVLSIVVIYAIINTMIKQNDLNKIINNKEYDNIFKIRDILYIGENMKKIFESCSVVIIFLSCLKMFSLINLGKFFSIISKTFEIAKGNILVFIIIIILVHPSFIFYAHLTFGENDIQFYQIQSSIKSCLLAFFGYIDFKQLYSNDKSFGSIFFFVYLIFINLIFLNLFVSILYRSYIQIKVDIVGRVEVWNPLNVFLICKKRKFSENKISIDNEFDRLNNDEQKKFKTSTLIYKENFSYDEFIKNEKEQIHLLNDKIIKEKNKRRDARLSYDTNQIGKNFIFDDNLYKDIKYEHLRAFIIDDYYNMLNIAEELDKDIININDAIEHLEKHDKYMNYDNLIKNTSEKNESIKLKVKELDENFLKIQKDLKSINENNIDMEKFKFKYNLYNDDENNFESDNVIIENNGSEIEDQMLENNKNKKNKIKENLRYENINDKNSNLDSRNINVIQEDEDF